MKLIKILLALLMSAMLFSAFSQAPGNFSTLRVTTLNGNMKANGTSLVTADTLNLKADTLRADSELYVRDSTLLQIIAANASGLEVVGNVNNRVLTATGGDSIQGEANFTFDGTTATVTGELNVDEINLNGKVIKAGSGSDWIDIQSSADATDYVRFQDGGNFSYWYQNNSVRGIISTSTVFATGSVSSLMQYNGRGSDNTQASVALTGISTSDIGAIPITIIGSTLGSSAAVTRPTLAGYNFTTKQWEVAANGTWDYQGNALTGISQATITNTGATAGLTVTKSGSGNGITVTNSGSGLAGQFGNIGLNANTISSTNANGNILLTPNGTGYTDITAGGLRIAGTERISNAGAFTGTTATLSSNLIVRNGISIALFGANTGGDGTITDATRKISRIGAPHYTNSEEPMSFALLDSEVGNSTVSIGGGTSTMNAVTRVRFFTAANTTTTTGTQRWEINTDGHFVPTGSVTLGLTGTRVTDIFTVNQTTTNAETVTSDSTLKENIVNITGALDKVKQIRPVEYTWKSDSTQKTHYGVIAQELETVYPELVISQGETLGVRYGELVPILLKAIQELEARVKELEGN